MPSFLIVVATRAEAQPLINHFGLSVPSETGFFEGNFQNKKIALLITGVGMVNTAFWMGKIAAGQFDHVINAGVCGAFDRSLQIGEVVNVVQDSISEMGAQDDEAFIRYNDMNLGGSNLFESRITSGYAPLNELKKIRSVTVNTVHGHEPSILKVRQLFDPQAESMEGAAFLRGCESFENYYQLRAVSNYVEKRDKSKWNLPLAVTNVNLFVIALIEQSPS